MGTLIELKQALSTWDEKSAEKLRTIYKSHYQQTDFISSIIKLVPKAPYQKGSTCLLKMWLEDENQPEKQQIKTIYGLLDSVDHWESKLHLLQSIPFMPIEKDDIKNVEYFLRQTLADSNKFIRAWSYNGFYCLAKQYPEYEKETKQFFEMALRDEAPSVISRIRNIMKQGF